MNPHGEPEQTPAPEPVTPAETPAAATPASDSTPSVPPPPATPAAAVRKPPAPVIEYAMPQSKSYLPSPALIKNLGCIFKLLFGFTVLLCMGYFALMAMNPKARQWALQGSKAGPGGQPAGKGPTPFKALNQVLAIPAQALGKTDDVVKANNARVAQLGGLIKEEEGKEKKRSSGGARFDPDAIKAATAALNNGQPNSNTSADSNSAAPADTKSAPSGSRYVPPENDAAGTNVPLTAPPPAPDLPAQITIGGGIVVSRASPAGAPPASQPFFYWVASLNLGGIIPGKPSRLLINGKLYYEGDLASPSLAITFAQLDAAKKLLIFRDSSGAVVTRSY